VIGKIIVLAGILVVAISAAAIVVFSVSQDAKTATADAPNVKFVAFDADRYEIRVSETLDLVYNVQNFEERPIDDARVTILIEPSSYEPYLSISNKTTELPVLPGKDAATGEIHLAITALGSPAKEAVYVVKGVLFIEGMQSDVRQFELKILQ
jgi:hypothetical protein